MVVVAAGGDERGLVAAAVLELEAEHADVEGERAVEVADLEVNVADVDAWIDAHSSRPEAASHQTQYASQGMPYASVWIATNSTAASIAASAASARCATSPAEQREVPRDEQERAEQAGLDAELGVVRLAGLERHVLAERDLAGVAEPVALRVVGRRSLIPSRSSLRCDSADGSSVVGPCLVRAARAGTRARAA